MDETTGYVMGSKMLLWTNVLNKDMLNVVHMHVNDTSDSVAIDLKYVQDDEYNVESKTGAVDLKVLDFSKETFKTDETGTVLRYKVLVKDT